MKKDLLALLAISVSVLCISACSKTLSDKVPAASQRNNSAEGYLDVNEEDPGKEIDIKSSIVYGKYTIMDFTSPGCGPCQEIKPYLQKLHDKRPDIVVRSFDINRSGTDGIDFESPLASQYKLDFVPYFKIYNEKGVQIADGRDATKQVFEVVNKELIGGGQ